MSHLSVNCSKIYSTLTTKVFTSSGNLFRHTKLKVPYPHHVLISNEAPVRLFSSDPPENPVKRTWNIIKSDLKLMVDIVDGHVTKEEIANRENRFPSECDILIIGGGIIGSSIAYWLQQRALSGLKIVVVEKDSSVIISNNEFEYCTASTTLSAGGLRHQFSLPENIQMSMFGAEFLRNIDSYLGIDGFERPDVSFTPQGYLFLATEKSAHILEENSKLQQSFGAKNELLTPKKIKDKWPWMNTESIALGCHGLENEGWFDPWSLLMAFKRKAISLGTQFINGELESFEFKNMHTIVMDTVPLGEYEQAIRANIKLPDGETKTITFSQLVIAAGCNSKVVGEMAKMGSGHGFLNLPIPVEPRKRYVYCFHCPNGPGWQAPFVIDPSGVYFRREGFGDNYICGQSPDVLEEPSCDNLDVDYKFFEENIWPTLAHRVPAFEALKMKSAWAGFYDFNTFDENALIGPHPSYMNVFIATGFSGHGLQQAPAVGRAIMELIIDGRYVTIDLTRMQFERIFHDEQLLETNIV